MNALHVHMEGPSAKKYLGILKGDTTLQRTIKSHFQRSDGKTSYDDCSRIPAATAPFRVCMPGWSSQARSTCDTKFTWHGESTTRWHVLTVSYMTRKTMPALQVCSNPMFESCGFCFSELWGQNSDAECMPVENFQRLRRCICYYGRVRIHSTVSNLLVMTS